MSDNKMVGILMLAFAIILFIIILLLKKASKKINADNENTFKLSMVSEICYNNEEIDKCFILSSFTEEKYNYLDSNRISIKIIIENDGKISVDL